MKKQDPKLPVPPQALPTCTQGSGTVCLTAMLCILILFGLPKAWAADYSWQEQQATVLPNGDLQWAPEPYVFDAAGQTLRYIDYDNGDDNNTGASTGSAWKHHPFDPAAGGNAAAYVGSGPTTYVFKGGVIYRGQISGKDPGDDSTQDYSGTASTPVRFVYDPNWGTGRAEFWGSDTIPASWVQATSLDAALIPDGLHEPDQVWAIDLVAAGLVSADGDWYTRPHSADRRSGVKLPFIGLFRLESDGTVVEQHLARSPNWQEGNDQFALDYWHTWTSFQWPKTESGKTLYKMSQDDDLIDPSKPADYYDGAYFWTQYRNLMGTPIPYFIQDFVDGEGNTRKAYNPDTGEVKTTGYTANGWDAVTNGTRYMIENMPELLDTNGEFYYDKTTKHLFLRVANGEDPNTLHLELVNDQGKFAFTHVSHIEISGINFKFIDDITISLSGDCQDITISHCNFEHLMDMVIKGDQYRDLQFHEQWRSDTSGYFRSDMEDIRIADCEFRNNWSEGISISLTASDQPPFHYLGHIEVLRNNFYNNGIRQRGNVQNAIPQIRLSYPETAEVAGNVIHKNWGSGIMVNGSHQGKGEIMPKAFPLSRLLVHHNKTLHTNRANNDYGGLSLWQNGSLYCYNNNVGSAVGHIPGWTNLAYPYYLDAGFKMYGFNNIVWGRSTDDSDIFRNSTPGYFNVFGFLNHFVNNTVYRQGSGVGGSSGNRNDTLGNVFAEISNQFLANSRGDDPSIIGGGGGGNLSINGIPTLAYGNNVFHGDAVGGKLTSTDDGDPDDINADKIADMAVQMADYDGTGLRYAQLGIESDDQIIGGYGGFGPMSNTNEADFRLTGGSPAIDYGVDYFIPWQLHGCVGEWNFNENHADPQTLVDFSFYMTRAHFNRQMYQYIPSFNLEVVTTNGTIDLADYVASDSEDWVNGAMHFDGAMSASITDAALRADVEIPISTWGRDLPYGDWYFDLPSATDGDGNPVRGEISADGTTATFANSGDNWERIELTNPVTLTADTILEFAFNSPAGEKGRLHAIALDDDREWEDECRLISVYGTKHDGENFTGLPRVYYETTYDTVGSDKTYSFKLVDLVAQYPGYHIGDVVTHLVFVNERDSGSGQSIFKNIKIYEDGETPQILDLNAQASGLQFYDQQMDDVGEFAADAKMYYPGDLRETPLITTQNLLVEAIIRTGASNAAIVGKHDGSSGYRLFVENGKAKFEVSAGGSDYSVVSAGTINDGNWHHVIAEIDRVAQRMTIYVDGQQSNETTGIGLGAATSIDTGADFIVGKSNSDSHYLVGDLDFLRIAHGTLADAKTDIAELYEWQSNGPVKYDFAGNTPQGGGRDAGALETGEPFSVSNLEATYNVSTGDIELTWTDNSTVEDGFIVERSTTPDFSADVVSYTIDNPDATGFADTTAGTGIAYYYRVYTTSGSDTSPHAGPLEIGVGTEAPDTPVKLGFEVDHDAGSITVKWDLLDENNLFTTPESWTVKWSTTSGTGYSSQTGITAKSHTITGLDTTQPYYVIVEATNGTASTATSEFAVFDYTEDFEGVAVGNIPAGWSVTDPLISVQTAPAEFISPSGTPLCEVTSKDDIYWTAGGDMQYQMVEGVFARGQSNGHHRYFAAVHYTAGSGQVKARPYMEAGGNKVDFGGRSISFTPDEGETSSDPAMDVGEMWTLKVMTGPASSGDPNEVDIYVQFFDQDGNDRIDPTDNDIEAIEEGWYIRRNETNPGRGTFAFGSDLGPVWLDSLSVRPFVTPGVTFDEPQVTANLTPAAVANIEAGGDAFGDSVSSVGNLLRIFWDEAGMLVFQMPADFEGSSVSDTELTMTYRRDVNIHSGDPDLDLIAVRVNGSDSTVNASDFEASGGIVTTIQQSLITGDTAKGSTVTLSSTGKSNLASWLSNASAEDYIFLMLKPAVTDYALQYNGFGGTYDRYEIRNDAVNYTVPTLTVTYGGSGGGGGTAPEITTQPIGTTVYAGENAGFTGAAGGDPVPDLQWQVDDGSGWSDLTGETSGTLTLLSVTDGMDGNQYRLVASNSEGQVNSNAATLDVTANTGFPGLDGANLGAASVSVTTEQSDGDLEQAGNGAGIDQTVGNDQISFDFQAVTGDFEATLNLKALTGGSNARVVLMMREDADGDGVPATDDAFVYLGTDTGDGYVQDRRGSSGVASDGEIVTLSGGNALTHAFPAKWVLIKRENDVLTLAVDDNDDGYLEVDESAIDVSGLNADTLVGVATWSGDGAATAISETDAFNVTLLSGTTETINATDSGRATDGDENGAGDSTGGDTKMGNWKGDSYGIVVFQLPTTVDIANLADADLEVYLDKKVNIQTSDPGVDLDVVRVSSSSSAILAADFETAGTALMSDYLPSDAATNQYLALDGAGKGALANWLSSNAAAGDYVFFRLKTDAEETYDRYEISEENEANPPKLTLTD